MLHPVRLDPTHSDPLPVGGEELMSHNIMWAFGLLAAVIAGILCYVETDLAGAGLAVFAALTMLNDIRHSIDSERLR